MGIRCQRAFEPTQAQLKQAESALKGRIDLATKLLSVLEDELSEFVTPIV
jgi:hypothetical protein